MAAQLIRPRSDKESVEYYKTERKKKIAAMKIMIADHLKEWLKTTGMQKVKADL